MTRFNVLFATITVCLLTACASEPTQDSYYSLVLAADDVPVKTDSSMDGALLTVGPIRMARYLNQSGLAMQKGAQQIHIANHSFWAEPLDEAIGKVLVRDISNRDSSLVVSRKSGRWPGEGNCQLRLEFDKFHATDSANVVARGRYWISTSDTKGDSVQSEFDLNRELSINGYANAVTELRAILGELSEQIVVAIAQHEVCVASDTH